MILVFILISTCMLPEPPTEFNANINNSTNPIDERCLLCEVSWKIYSECVHFRYCITHLGSGVDMFMTIPIIILIVVFSIVGRLNPFPAFSYGSQFQPFQHNPLNVVSFFNALFGKVILFKFVVKIVMNFISCLACSCQLSNHTF